MTRHAHSRHAALAEGAVEYVGGDLRRGLGGREAQGVDRPPGGSGSGSGPRSPSARTAAGPRSSRPARAIRQPAASSRSMIAWVIARPRPRPRHAGSTKIVPIQPTAPFAVPTPVRDDAPVRLGDQREAVGLRRREREPLAADAPVVAEDHLGRRLDVGRRHRAEEGVGMPFSIIRRWLDSPARTSSTSPSSRASA